MSCKLLKLHSLQFAIIPPKGYVCVVVAKATPRTHTRRVFRVGLKKKYKTKISLTNKIRKLVNLRAEAERLKAEMKPDDCDMADLGDLKARHVKHILINFDLAKFKNKHTTQFKLAAQKPRRRTAQALKPLAN